MCEFCHTHGEGKKWYLNAKNYAEDLLSDARRRGFISQFFAHPEHLSEAVGRLDQLERAPRFVRRVVRWAGTRWQKKHHWGQVVPLEDLERILDFTNTVTRMACVCRHLTGMKDARYCYGVSIPHDGGEFGRIVAELDPSFLSGPGTAGIESLTKDEALAQFRSHEREGLCHTVWTFITPFIGGICNCDRADCLAMRATVTHRFPVMFRAEYVAEADPDLCSGCRSCMRVCQFGAISFSATRRKVEIDPRRCFGCGSCRSVCQREAIRLVDRRAVPAAKGLW